MTVLWIVTYFLYSLPFSTKITPRSNIIELAFTSERSSAASFDPASTACDAAASGTPTTTAATAAG